MKIAALFVAALLPLHGICAIEAVSFSQEGDTCRAVLKVAPTGPTYLTAKYEGGQRDLGRFFIADAEGKLIPWTELDEGGLFHPPGEVYYQTVQIPLCMTDGKKQIELTLKAESMPVKKIAGLWTHSNALFLPPGAMKNASPVILPRFKPFAPSFYDKFKKKNIELLSMLAEDVAKRQMWREDWKDFCERGEWHEDLVGAFDVPWIGKDKVMDVTATKDAIPGHYDKLNNNGPLLLAVPLAVAYRTPGTKQYRDRTTLVRIAAFLDFCRRAQGVGGSYWSAWVKGKWMGGPNRGPDSGTPLDGAGIRGIGETLCLVAKALEEYDLLEELVDDDCNPETPKIKRRQVYLDLCDALIGHFVRSRGHAPNQESYQLEALRFSLKARRMLGGASPNEPAPKEFIARLMTDCGAVKRGEWSYVSPEGIPLEHDGYSVEYGRGQDQMYYRLWQFYKKCSFLRERAKVGGDAFTHFVYPRKIGDGAPFAQVCAFLNFRHRNMVAGDGYGASDCQLLDFENPSHIRLKQLEWMNLEKDIDNWDIPRRGNWYWTAAYGFADSLADRLKIVKRMCDPDDPLCADVKLPMESAQPDFVWGDARAQCLAFMDGESRVMMNFNQWNHHEAPNTNGVAFICARFPDRVQYLRVPHSEIIQTKSGEPLRWGCHTLVFGNWFVVQNSDPQRSVNIDIPAMFRKNAQCVILGSNKKLKGSSVSIPAHSTIVVKRTNLP